MMEHFGFFSTMQVVLIVGVLAAIIYRSSLIEFEQRIIAAIKHRRHSRQARELESIGMSVVPAPAMTATEIVRLIEDAE